MINWGIIGAGNIAHRFAKGLSYDSNAHLYAISCRRQEKADAFIQQYPADKIYLDYAELLEDENIDAVYVSLPHILHKEWSIKALNKKKAVLCEKPATINRKEMEEIAQAAKENDSLFMEAMKTRFVPAYREIKNIIENRELGELVSIKTVLDSAMLDSDVGKNSSYVLKEKQGGGLLDSGIYCACWLEDYFKGDISLERIDSIVNETDIDIFVDAHLNIGSHRAELETALDRTKPKEAVLTFTEGSITVRNLHRPEEFIICKDGAETLNCKPYDHDDFYSQIAHFNQLILEGKKESDIMPPSASIRCAEILDVIRSGIQYHN